MMLTRTFNVGNKTTAIAPAQIIAAGAVKVKRNLIVLLGGASHGIKHTANVLVFDSARLFCDQVIIDTYAVQLHCQLHD